MADDAVAALAELGPRWPQRLREPDRRVAIAGPFAGSASGIGQYDESVLEAIERRRLADPTTPAVEVFVDSSGTSAPTDVGAGRRPVRAIGRYAKPWDFDHLVAVLGSSPHHVATAESGAVRVVSRLAPRGVARRRAPRPRSRLGQRVMGQATRRRSPRRRRVAATISLIESRRTSRCPAIRRTRRDPARRDTRPGALGDREQPAGRRRPFVACDPTGHRCWCCRSAIASADRTDPDSRSGRHRGSRLAGCEQVAGTGDRGALAARARRHAHVRRPIGGRHRRHGPSARRHGRASPIGCRSPDASTTMSTPSASPGAGSAFSSARAIEVRCRPRSPT